jgi:hypothetical protein
VAINRNGKTRKTAVPSEVAASPGRWQAGASDTKGKIGFVLPN